MASLSVSLGWFFFIFLFIYFFMFFSDKYQLASIHWYSQKERLKIRKLNRVKDAAIKAVEDEAPPRREILHSLVPVKSRKNRGRVYQLPFKSSMFVFNFNTVKKKYSQFSFCNLESTCFAPKQRKCLSVRLIDKHLLFLFTVLLIFPVSCITCMSNVNSIQHMLTISPTALNFEDGKSLVKSCVYSLWTVKEVALTAVVSIFTSYYQFLG